MSALAIIELVVVLLPIVEKIIAEAAGKENSEEVKKAEQLLSDLLGAATSILKVVGK